MRFVMELTIDDLMDAARPVRPNGRPVKRSWLGGGGVAAAILVATVATATFNPAAREQWHRRTTADGTAILPQNLWVAVVPGLVPAVWVANLIALGTVQQWRQRRAIARGEPPAGPRRSAAGGVVAAWPIVLLFVWDWPPVVVTWWPTPTATMWAAFTPWAVLFVGVMVAFGLGGPRRAARRTAAASPDWAGPWTVDVTPVGVRFDGERTDTHYRWPAIAGYRETDGLLVLTLRDRRTLLLPKRAVAADPDGEAELRSLIQTHVAAGSFLPREARFPVVDVAGA